MSVHNRAQTDVQRPATPQDVRHVLGDVEDTVVAEILALNPTFRDLAEAAIWTRGDGDLTAREHHELSAAALAIAEILTREQEELVDEPD